MPSGGGTGRLRKLLLILAVSVSCGYEHTTMATDPLTIEIIPTELTVAAGYRGRLTAIVSPPEETTGLTSSSSDVVNWTSDNPEVASVDLLGGPDFPGGTGVIVTTSRRGLESSTPVCGKRPGRAVLTASYAPQLGQLRATAVITVAPNYTGVLQCLAR